MLNKKICELINSQINKELESAYLYLGFSNYFKERNLDGFAHWYEVQAQEEIDHAMKFVGYLHSNDCQVKLEAIRVVDDEFNEDMEVLSKGLQHEKYVTALIENIYKEAIDEKDLRTQIFLDWFIIEQAEEEENAQKLIDDYNIFVYDCDCGCSCGLYEMDKDLSERKD